jgi:altronate dehydratase
MELKDGSRTIPVYNKVATTDIPVGGKIIKYGTAIGTATSLIRKGQLIDQHISYSQDGGIHLSGNIKEFRNQLAIPQHYLDSAIQNYQVLVKGFESEVALRPKEKLMSGLSIMAYRNRDGSIGSRRHILIIPSVFCTNQEAHDIARPFADTSWGISN